MMLAASLATIAAVALLAFFTDKDPLVAVGIRTVDVTVASYSAAPAFGNDRSRLHAIDVDSDPLVKHVALAFKLPALHSRISAVFHNPTMELGDILDTFPEKKP